MRVKICGITTQEDATAAANAGADWLGFILYPKSPRYVTPAQVRSIIAHLRSQEAATAARNPTETPQPRSVRFVGVFVNESVERMASILADAQLDYAQLHGDEGVDVLQQLAGRAYKAIRPVNLDDALRLAERFAPLGMSSGPQLLIDAFDPLAYGGTGQRADWHAAAQLARQVPRLLLAGGLTPENVTAAIETVRPWGVDVSSGVETAPGRKDHARLRLLIEKAKGA